VLSREDIAMARQGIEEMYRTIGNLSLRRVLHRTLDFVELHQQPMCFVQRESMTEQEKSDVYRALVSLSRDSITVMPACLSFDIPDHLNGFGPSIQVFSHDTVHRDALGKSFYGDGTPDPEPQSWRDKPPLL
jgi:hypothetical protein